jgi:hypothetical protein
VNRNRILHLAILAAAFAAVVPCQAQPRAFTSADYARAEKFMNYNTTPLMFRASVQPNWLPDERMWYRVVTADGSEFILVDPARGTREPAFDLAVRVVRAFARLAVHLHYRRLPSLEMRPARQCVRHR